MSVFRGFTGAGAGATSAATLTTLGAWKRELYRLLNTSADDDALTEHDSVTLEGLLVGLQVGLDEAQEWLLRAGLSGRWATRSDALSWSGTDATTGGRYANLPSDFRRIAGDSRISALTRANGDRWGRWVEWEDRAKHGTGYYLRDSKLWLLRGANPPTPLYLEYIRRLTIPTDDTASFSEFPRWALSLIPAFAAEYLIDEAFLPGGPELEGKIQRRLFNLKKYSVHQLRMTQGPRRIKAPPVTGNRYWL